VIAGYLCDNIDSILPTKSSLSTGLDTKHHQPRESFFAIFEMVAGILHHTTTYTL